MSNGIEGFCEVKLQQNNPPSRSMALMDILVGPGETILNCPPLEKTVLIMVYQL